MNVARYGATATLLSVNGRVLVTGGYTYDSRTLSSAELYGNPLACY